MRFSHPAHGARRVRLCYCLNVHPTQRLEDVHGALEQIAAPLRARLQPDGVFGVGLYLPGAVAAGLLASAGRGELLELRARLRDGGFEPFSFNAFPFGQFHQSGLKARVFEPTWTDPRRAAYTREVAQIGAFFAEGSELAQISISTHTGGHSSHAGVPGFGLAVAQELLACARFLAELEQRSGVRCLLALEPEPRSNTNDIQAWRAQMGELLGQHPEASAARHLALCLDACHAAVEFEDLTDALGAAKSCGLALGKLQFTTALRLRDPGQHPAARARLLAMAEPIYLHQLTAQVSLPSATSKESLLRLGDLDEWGALDEPTRRAWLAAREWRCHFHVPVFWRGDLPGTPGLSTTQLEADALLLGALSQPELWGSPELHLEIETYTWHVLKPKIDPTSPGLVDGLEQEYLHVLALLAAAGWMRDPA